MQSAYDLLYLSCIFISPIFNFCPEPTVSLGPPKGDWRVTKWARDAIASEPSGPRRHKRTFVAGGGGDLAHSSEIGTSKDNLLYLSCIQISARAKTFIWNRRRLKIRFVHNLLYTNCTQIRPEFWRWQPTLCLTDLSEIGASKDTICI